MTFDDYKNICLKYKDYFISKDEIFYIKTEDSIKGVDSQYQVTSFYINPVDGEGVGEVYYDLHFGFRRQIISGMKFTHTKNTKTFEKNIQKLIINFKNLLIKDRLDEIDKDFM